MPTLFESPSRAELENDQTAFNLAVWDKLQLDESLAALPYRIETNRYGQLIMSPPPAPSHGNNQVSVAFQLKLLQTNGKVLTECPVSTSEGVKAADVAWCSPEIWESAKEKSCFTRCPEILVEVISPSNTKREIHDKTALYFEAGAREVWHCSKTGEMTFFRALAESIPTSNLVPDFPTVLPDQ